MVATRWLILRTPACPRRTWCAAWPAVVIGTLITLISGCAGITVYQTKPPILSEAVQANAIVVDDLSPRTLQTLRRWDLENVYRRSLGEAAIRLHDIAVKDPQPEFLFALAEMCYLLGAQAEKKDSPDACMFYYLCAGYAYHYLFDGPASAQDRPAHDPAAPAELPASVLHMPSEAQNPFDPRFRLACDLYNAGLAHCIRAAQRNDRLDPCHELRLATPDGKGCTLSVKHHGFTWPAEEFGPLLLCSDSALTGLVNQYRTYGLGVPLIGTRKAAAATPQNSFYPPEVSFPVTAFFRYDGTIAQLGERRAGQLELYNPLAAQTVSAAGRTVSLESDLTTPLAYFLAHADLEGIEYTGFLRAERVQQQAGIYMLEPYQPGKIPVVMVHGLLSSPLTWAPMFNDLRADPELRRHFQFWFYLYPTGNPYLTAAADLRQALNRMRTVFDAEQRDPALNHMVFVGHSMGGLVSKLLTVSSGEDFWGLVSHAPLADLKARPQTRAELERLFYFERHPGIERVIFLGTPHHGSALTPSPVAQLATQFVQAPQTAMQAVRDLVQENPDVRLILRPDRLPTSVDLLAPRAPALEVLASRPVPAGVHYHSIIGQANGGDTLRRIGYVLGERDERTDGVVPYASAHLDNADSELVVAADHSFVHQHPLAVLEVRRILLQHLREVRSREAWERDLLPAAR